MRDVVLVLLFRGVSIPLVSDILIGILCIISFIMIFSETIPYIVMWFMVMPLFKVILRGKKIGLVWKQVKA